MSDSCVPVSSQAKPRPQPTGDGGVARQVDALLDRHHRGQRDLVDLPSTDGLALGDGHAVADLERLDADDAWASERDGDADADLEAAQIGRLIAEHEQVEGAVRRFLGPDLHGQGRGRRDRVPVAAAGVEKHSPVGADGHGLAQLVLCFGGAEGHDRRRAAVCLHQPDSLFDGTLLMRADGEAQEPGVDVLRIAGQGDLPTGRGDALDADEDIHRRSSALDAHVLGIEERPAAGDRHRHGVVLAEVLDDQLGAFDGLCRRQIGHQEVLADRRS